MSQDELPETDRTAASGAPISASPQPESSHDAAQWAWATEHSAPEWASTEQLVAWLARGELPPHTLVWKQGWGEWLPAMQVVELAAAFPRVTAGSRRVARAGAKSDAPPAVPMAHYPRLRLLAKDVLSESPLPPAPASLTPAQAERRGFRDRDQLQKDLVTSQVPAAAMLEAARAMKQLGAPGLGSSAERWSRLQLGTFGEPPPAAPAPPCSPPSRTSNTLSPHAVELPAPAELEPAPQALPQPSKRYSRWLVVGALAGGLLGLLSISWPEAEALLALAGASLA
ncbi:MAG TPA: DUF4339 domain-containing protein, partial [Polyangiaceae bacterium]|nr:DUF4339 domain-containing protein [Polyangiaceae bacterium]